MERNKVSPVLLVNLDASMHQRDLVEVRARLRAFAPKTIAALGANVTKGTTPTTVGFRYESSGVRFIRSQNVHANILDGEFNFISNECHQALKRSQLNRGDVLINLVGASIGRCCVFPFHDSANINQAVGRIRFHCCVDSHFVSTWINCRFSQQLIEAEQSGLARDNFDLEQVRELMIPVLDDKAQKYIGDKVRQAERMREFARGNINLVNLELDRFIPPYEVIPQAISRVSTQRFGTRLDCQPYRTHFLSLRDSLSKISTNVLKDIADVLPGDPVPSDEFATRGVPLVRIRDINASGFQIAETYVSEIYSKNNPSGRAHPFDIVVGMDGEFRAQMILGEELPRHINQRIGIIRATGIAPSLLAFWLNRQEGQFQLNQWSVKTTVDHTSLEYIRMVRIPRLSLDKEDELSNVLSCSARSNYYSRVCVSASKLLVEALIERKIT